MHIYNLKTLKFEHNSVFREFLEKSEPMWGMYFPLLYSNRKNVLWDIINGSLCVFQKGIYSKLNEYQKNWSLAFLPVPFNKAAFDECFLILNDLNKSEPVNVYNINDIDSAGAALNTHYGANFKSDGKEYIYNAHTLKGLQGAEYKKIRHYINHFEKASSPKIERYAPSMYRECLKLFNEWKERKLEESNTILYKEHTKEMFNELMMFEDMFGIVVRINGAIAAFTLGGILSDARQTATCIIRKTVPEIRGLGEYIDWNFYNYLPEKIKIVNDGDDCMSPGLAEYKMKWRPENVQPIFKAKITAIK